MNLSRPSTGEIRVGLSGAAGSFGRTVLLALRAHPTQRASVLCDLDLASLRRTLVSLGYDPAVLMDCRSSAEVRRVSEAGGIALVQDAALLAPEAYDVLVEATGVVGVSTRAAIDAIDAGRCVVLASKETESLFGRALSERAAAQGVVCTTGAGDQPANLVALLEWAGRLGMEVVAAGKSSEYDLIFDPATERASVLDSGAHASELAGLWELGEDVSATLAARGAAAADLPLGAAADYCEIAVVANLTGLPPASPRLHYPLARWRELADIYRHRDEGGILSAAGVLDVFVLLREPDEVSFAGGEFIVVRCPDADVANMLERKGHVVSRSRDHLCIALPFHLMGLEIPGTIADALQGRPVAAPSCRRTSMIAVAEGDLEAGHALAVAGHHHDIAGVTPQLVSADEAGEELVPYYLLDGARLSRDVAAGTTLRYSDIEGIDPLLRELAALDRSPAKGVS